MESPPGLPHVPLHVCRLQHIIYDLEQARHAWFEKFSAIVLAISFIQSPCELAMFIHMSPRDWTILLFYVDDMAIIDDDPSHIQSVKETFNNNFR